MFAGEWTIKVLGWLGMEEGMAIEDKRITKGILRAQKKVEERNFLARKNLLEYDEVMDHQRTTFYGMRQQVLEGREVDRGHLGDDRRLDRRRGREIHHARITSPPTISRVGARPISRSTSTPTTCSGNRAASTTSKQYIKDQARAEAETQHHRHARRIHGRRHRRLRTAGTPRACQSWAMSRFQVNLSQSQIRKMTPTNVEEKLREAAVEQIDKRDVRGPAEIPRAAVSPRASWRHGRRRSSTSRSSPRRCSPAAREQRPQAAPRRSSS